MSYINKIDKILVKSYSAFILAVGLAHALYFTTLAGIIYVNPQYIHTLNVATQMFICVFLLVRFHPFRVHELNQIDTRIIFGSAVLLASNLLAVEISKTYLGRYVDNISNKIQNNIQNRVDNAVSNLPKTAKLKHSTP